MSGPRYTSLVRELPATVPFVGPEAQERQRGAPFLARIGANESVFGLSPMAVEAMAIAARDCWQYGDPETHDLKAAIAAHHDVDPANVVVGEGIDALLGYLVRLLVEPGVPVVTSAGAYPTFNYHVAGFGGRLVTVPYKDDAEDPDGLLRAVERNSAPLVYFANPDNPMGSWHSAATVQSMIDAVPDGSVLCLDEAYAEFAPDDTIPPLDVTNRRLIRFRTFSKGYGMAGARVGYGIGEAGLIASFNKVRNHFGVNRIAQAGAIAALGDQRHLEQVRKHVHAARERIGEIARTNGLVPLPSAANFVAIDCGRDEAFAKAVMVGLVAAGVFVRMPFVAPQSRCIRVTVGRPEDLDVFEATLPEVLATVRAAHV